MPSEEVPNNRTSSTTFGWRYVKISPAPQANEHRERSEASLRSLLPWPKRKPITVVLKYRGGAEAWVEIRTRGRVIRRPGSVQLIDLLQDIMQTPL